MNKSSTKKTIQKPSVVDVDDTLEIAPAKGTTSKSKDWFSSLRKKGKSTKKDSSLQSKRLSFESSADIVSRENMAQVLAELKQGKHVLKTFEKRTVPPENSPINNPSERETSQRLSKATEVQNSQETDSNDDKTIEGLYSYMVNMVKEMDQMLEEFKRRTTPKTLGKPTVSTENPSFKQVDSTIATMIEELNKLDESSTNLVGSVEYRSPDKSSPFTGTIPSVTQK